MEKLYDLIDRADIELVVDLFYKKAMTDDVIGHFFGDPNPIDLSHHLPIICDFWESILFGTGSYRGNPMIKHIELNKLHSLNQNHFDRWLMLWSSSINKLYQGTRADEMIAKAQVMAKLMRYKIEQSGNLGFIQ